MQDKFSTTNDSFEALEDLQATELGMILDTMFHKPKDKRVDVDNTGPRQYTFRGKLHKINRKRNRE